MAAAQRVRALLMRWVGAVSWERVGWPRALRLNPEVVVWKLLARDKGGRAWDVFGSSFCCVTAMGACRSLQRDNPL